MNYIGQFCKDFSDFFSTQLEEKFDIQTSVIALLGADGFKRHVGFGRGFEEALSNPSKSVDLIFRACLDKHPEAHIHSVKNYAFPFQAKKKVEGEPRYSALFVPIDILQKKGVFIGLVSPDFDRRLLKDAISCAENLIKIVNHEVLLNTIEHRLIVTEHFVKEIGHDISSYAQATLGKAKLISRGGLSSEAIVRTAKEIESEVLWACNVADYFGLAIESNYQVREKNKFVLADAVEEAIHHFEAEANERRILLEHDVQTRARVVGDKPAIRQAMAHLVLNAVKYSVGGSSVRISTSVRNRELKCTIWSTGTPLPKIPELYQIWDFGFRGSRARELHVNGSGIGLYTVKKIVEGHGGRVWCEANKNSSLFGVAIPEANF
jgi:signal transduction histidine kinase